MIELPVLQNGDEQEDGSRSGQTRFWRSIEHLEGDPGYRDFIDSELMPGASGSPGQTTRRGFLHVMGASMALAGLAGCRKPMEAIMPFARRPEDMIPGVPMSYATSMEFRGALRPLVVESTDGRPTKIEGNPEHPESDGSSGVFEQASLLGLYDPDRSRQVRRDGDVASWSDFTAFAASRPANDRIAFLAPPSSSLTLASVRAQAQARFPAARWIEYDGAGSDVSAAALQRAYGRPLRARYDLARAQVILSLESDFLSMTHPDGLHNSAGFSRSRNVDATGHMSRLYIAESAFSVTGGMADHRRALKSSAIGDLAVAVARACGIAVPGPVVHQGDPWVQAVAADLQSAGSAAVVIAGEGQPERTHLLAAAINDALGAVGNTVQLLELPDGSAASRTGDLANLVRDMSAGRVDTLVMLGCNPVYDAPANLGFTQALAQVAETVHVGLHRDETAGASRWHVPMAHYLESWGDGRAFSGTPSVVQPLIAPLYDDAHSAIEVAGLFAAGRDRTGYDWVRETWQGLIGTGFESAWRRILHDGFSSLPGFASHTGTPAGLPQAIGSTAGTTAADGIEVVFQISSSVLDGSFANNAWLQELPDPATKIVWDNVAVMSPVTAERLGLGVSLSGGQHFVDRVSVAVGDGVIDAPAWIQHGVADDCVLLELGYGREIVSDRPRRGGHIFDLDHETDIYGQGAIASGVGVNVASLRTSGGAWSASATVQKSGSGYLIATTQDHGALPDEGAEMLKRGLYRMTTLADYQSDPYFVREGDPSIIDETPWDEYPTMWEPSHPASQPANKDNPYFANQWGMVIDLNSCTGCNACLVACQAENNIQVVGKDEVSRGREMHWIRMDRYFVGGDGSAGPMMVQQPVPCMHCENAPCEQVCPVAATVHSPDGTNQMIYNRCIGTRYCANNCPYKVRRFNYYNWTKTLPESLHMASNPNVTVRSRGVMEKCSYCIQRIREVNKQVNVENRVIRDGDVVTACQQACPSDAIVFGDLNDGTSAVSGARKNPRRYEMLAELNVKPRTSYLGRLRNPNPELEPAHAAEPAAQH